VSNLHHLLHPGTRFAKAQADRFTPSIAIPPDGSFPPIEFNMHVDDNLYATAGIDQMKWAMRRSIAGLQGIMGENQPEYRPCQPDMDKFLSQPISYERCQLGYATNTRTMSATIPDDKCHELLDNLTANWSSASGKNSFSLPDAASVLGLYTYLCQVCPWGIFLFQNLYIAMSQALS
jgi:hypothetical protein